MKNHEKSPIWEVQPELHPRTPHILLSWADSVILSDLSDLDCAWNNALCITMSLCSLYAYQIQRNKEWTGQKELLKKGVIHGFHEGKATAAAGHFLTVSVIANANDGVSGLLDHPALSSASCRFCTCFCWRQLVLLRAAMPPLSPAPMPSTSQSHDTNVRFYLRINCEPESC